MGEQTCANCKYWKRAFHEDIGECRRKAPSANGINRWSCTAPDEWCGEFMDKNYHVTFGTVTTPTTTAVPEGMEIK